MTSTTDDAPVAVLTSWCTAVTHALSEARAAINALNVYPVPDSDTGTNLHLTAEGATEALASSSTDDLEAAIGCLARGALLCARGNSGSILAQMIRAAGQAWVDTAAEGPSDQVAEMLASAALGGRHAVNRPVEGTMLSVMDAAAGAAEGGGPVVDVMERASQAARAALECTPDQLEPLRQAGVVDAGGAGLCVVLDCLADLASGGEGRVTHALGSGGSKVGPAPGADLVLGGPAYEVMYLLDADAAAVDELREVLAPLGDSLVIVGGDDLWSVHVHVDDVGAAIEAGVAAGRPHRICVTHFAEQQAGRSERSTTRAVVACAAGAGLEELFDEAGAYVVPIGPGRRVTVTALLQAIVTAHADEVIVLPNEQPSIATAEAAAEAARQQGRRVAVIPTRTQVQGLAAVAVRDDALRFGDEVAQMSSAAGHARSGGLTIATHDAMTMAGRCQAGQALGVVDGDFAVVGDDPRSVMSEVVDRLVGGGGELVTVLTGRQEQHDGELIGDLVDCVVERVAAALPLAEVTVYDGGQARYPLLMGIE